jgi:hypothetical protein
MPQWTDGSKGCGTGVVVLERYARLEVVPNVSLSGIRGYIHFRHFIVQRLYLLNVTCEVRQKWAMRAICSQEDRKQKNVKEVELMCIEVVVRQRGLLLRLLGQNATQRRIPIQ